jgi:hypothetical protein
MVKAGLLCGTTTQQIEDKHAAVSWVANIATSTFAVNSEAHEGNGVVLMGAFGQGMP